MNLSEKQSKKFKHLEDVIARAIKKVGVRQENELCKYIPAIDASGYMHHFTLKKMKLKNPDALAEIIEKFLIKVNNPPIIAPKQRAPRGSRKRRDQITFTRMQLERMLNIARLAGDKEIISILRPKKSLASYKRELILSIRQGRIDNELWNGYIEAVNALNNALNAISQEVPVQK